MKTDVKDAYLIARVIRIDSPDATPFIEEDLLRLRHLKRLRYSLIKTSLEDLPKASGNGCSYSENT